MNMEHQPSALNVCLHAVWRRTQKRHLSAGLLALGIWGIPIFLTGVVVDWFAFLPAFGRLVVLIVLLAVSFYQAWRHGWRHLRRFDAKRSALQIENHQGGLNSLLVTAVQFSQSGASPGTSQSLWEATRRKAEAAASGVSASKIITFAGLKRPLQLALLLVWVIGLFAVVNGPFLAAGLARIFAPWMAVAYPTNTHINLENGNLILKEGEAAKIKITLSALSGTVPTKAVLELRTGEGRPRKIAIDIKGGVGTYAIASASRDFSYRIKAGDARSDWYDARVVLAPRVANVKVGLEFPAYLEKPAETLEALTLTVPEGTRVKWHLTLDQPISKAALHRDGQEPLDLKISEDGRQLMIDEVVQASRGYSFSWVERKHGFDFTSPRYYMQVASDQPPRVELVSPDANLVAMLGRPLDLVVRAQDDHGIGAAAVTYRVNLRPEITVALTQPLRNGEGAQKIDWDYRKELTDLKVGDTVSFVVGIGDRYPEPHLARSDTRRITFLSREDYLAQVEKKLERLLSRVRAIYRQERAAHTLVRGLDVMQESFSQTCQLEAIRQEMLREQLKETAAEVRLLLADLKANNIADAVENEALKQICAELEKIADQTLAQAASLLREQAGLELEALKNQPSLLAADVMVNLAARALGKIVLQRGIDAAREVFALEVQMLAQEQAKLRYRSVELASAPNDQELEIISKHQAELAAWTAALLKDLEKGMRYDKRPLAVLSLTRRMKELRGSGIEISMKETAVLMQKRDFAPTAEKQALIIKPLLKAEFSVRAGAEYAAIKANRDRLDSLLDQQARLRAECEALTDEQFFSKRAEILARQRTLRKSMVQAMFPAIPAPRARLFDKAMPAIPPVDALRSATENGMSETMAEMKNGRKAAVIARLQAVEQSLAALAESVRSWSSELAMQTQGLTSLVSESMNRVSRIEEFENRQVGLLEQSEEAVLDKKPVKPLGESQRMLADDMNAFKRELLAQDKSNPSKDVQPLLNRIERVAAAMKKAAAAFETGKAEAALLAQEEASKALVASKELVIAQAARLTLLQGVFAFQRLVGNSYQATTDVVDQQNDLIKATKAADEKSAMDLIPTMKNLLQCLADVAPLLDAVAIRLDAGSALLFAGSDVEDALNAIKDGDVEDSLDAQEGAAESLTKVKALIHSVTEQTTYLAEIIEFLHESMADLALLESDQQQIRLKLEAKPGALPADIIQRLEDLQKTTASHGMVIQGVMGTLENFKAYKNARLSAEIEKLKKLQKPVDPKLLVGVPGMAEYTQAAKSMAEAVRLGKAGDTAAALVQMNLAERALKENEEQIFTVITMLHGLSTIEVLATSPPELSILLEVLALASDQRQIYQQARFGSDEVIPSLAMRQQKLETKYAKLVQNDKPHPLLIKAQQNTQQAAAAMKPFSRTESVRFLSNADESLRHYIIEQALILDTSLKPPSSSSDPVVSTAETTDLSVSDTVGSVSDFVSGEAPKDRRTEWEVLGTRNRAALNQNFARELPLEFRAMLKNYYEKVAK